MRRGFVTRVRRCRCLRLKSSKQPDRQLANRQVCEVQRTVGVSNMPTLAGQADYEPITQEVNSYLHDVMEEIRGAFASLSTSAESSQKKSHAQVNCLQGAASRTWLKIAHSHVVLNHSEDAACA